MNNTRTITLPDQIKAHARRNGLTYCEARREMTGKPSSHPITSAPSAPADPAIHRALQAVAEAFQVTTAGLLGPTREKDISQARHACWAILLDHGVPSSVIARTFHRKDGGTIRHGREHAHNLVRTDRYFTTRIADALKRFNAS